jgi:hypothetical protein
VSGAPSLAAPGRTVRVTCSANFHTQSFTPCVTPLLLAGYTGVSPVCYAFPMVSDQHQPPRRDGLFDPPLPAWQPIAQPQAPSPEIASVPRRYGPGTLLVVTTAYALLFAGFNALGGDQAWWIGAAVFFTGVGLAQMIAGPRRARAASLIAGLVLFPLTFATILFSYADFRLPPRDSQAETTAGLLCLLMWGAPMGYIGGVLVGGIFLLMRYADAAIGRFKRSEPEEEPIDVELVDGPGPDDRRRSSPLK